MIRPDARGSDVVPEDGRQGTVDETRPDPAPRRIWARPTVTDAPGLVQNPAGMPVMLLMMDGEAGS